MGGCHPKLKSGVSVTKLEDGKWEGGCHPKQQSEVNQRSHLIRGFLFFIQIQNLQTEIRVLSEKNSFLSEEKKRSDTDLSNCQRELSVLRSRQREGSAGDLADNKVRPDCKYCIQEITHLCFIFALFTSIVSWRI